MLHHRFHVIALSETWFCETNVTDSLLSGYNIESQYRKEKSGGGVSLLVSNDIDYTIRTDLSFNNDCIESLFLELPSCAVSKQRKCIVGVVYRPPNTSVKDFNDYITAILTAVEREKKACFLMGDFNINLLNAESHVSTAEFLEIMYSFSFLPLITKPTRVTSHSATLIDNIFSNVPFDQSKISGIFYTDISDHFPVFNIDLTSKYEETTQTKYSRMITGRNIDRFCTKLANTDWNPVLENHNAQLSFSIFHEKLKELYDDSFPLTATKSKYRNRKPWLTQGLKHSIKIKKICYII